MKTLLLAAVLIIGSGFAQANPSPIPSKNLMYDCVKQFHLMFDTEGKINLNLLKEKNQALMLVIKGKSGVTIFTDFFKNREKISKAYDLQNYTGDAFSVEIFDNKELVYSNTFSK